MISGIRKQQQLLVRWSNTNRSKKYRGKPVARLIASLYAKREKAFKRKRFGLNELIIDNYYLRVKVNADAPLCPMRIYK